MSAALAPLLGYGVIYLVHPYDVLELLETTSGRLVLHVVPALLYAACAALAAADTRARPSPLA